MMGCADSERRSCREPECCEQQDEHHEQVHGNQPRAETQCEPGREDGGSEAECYRGRSTRRCGDERDDQRRQGNRPAHRPHWGVGSAHSECCSGDQREAQWPKQVWAVACRSGRKRRRRTEWWDQWWWFGMGCGRSVERRSGGRIRRWWGDRCRGAFGHGCSLFTWWRNDGWGGVSGRRQRDGEAAARGVEPFHFDSPTVSLGDGLGDGESDAGSGAILAAR